ncbi:MAG: hypothetical protein ACOYJ2_02565 [Rickettsiales bacterium]
MAGSSRNSDWGQTAAIIMASAGHKFEQALSEAISSGLENIGSKVLGGVFRG